MAIVEICDVSKSYGGVEFCLSDINFSIEKGTVFALVGPNGAGKTTLVKLMLDLLHHQRGYIKINGLSSANKHSRDKVAFIPEKFTFFPTYTAKGVLEFFGKMKGLSSKELSDQVQKALTMLNIEDLADRKLSKMSKGQMQRVGLASILIGDNDLIILDEPFSGLDPIGIRDLKEIIKRLKSEGKTLFINSHILLEMEQLCDEVAILNKGKLLFKGTVSSVLEKEKSLEDFFYKTVRGELV